MTLGSLFQKRVGFGARLVDPHPLPAGDAVITIFHSLSSLIVECKITKDCNIKELHSQIEIRLKHKSASQPFVWRHMPNISHRRHRRCLCKLFLPGVKFYGLNVKIVDVFLQMLSKSHQICAKLYTVCLWISWSNQISSVQFYSGWVTFRYCISALSITWALCNLLLWLLSWLNLNILLISTILKWILRRLSKSLNWQNWDQYSVVDIEIQTSISKRLSG